MTVIQAMVTILPAMVMQPRESESCLGTITKLHLNLFLPFALHRTNRLTKRLRGGGGGRHQLTH